MRTAESICLLCGSTKATQRNSHIFPRFIFKSMLGNENPRRGYFVSARYTHIAQDPGKEDYILCPSCEKYFSVLETYVANKLHNRIRNIRYSSQFIDMRIEMGIIWKECQEVDPTVFRLFIYSIIWRCSISSTPLCDGFRLKISEEEIVKSSLLLYKYDNQTSLLDNIKIGYSPLNIIPFLIFTAESFKNKIGSFLFPFPSLVKQKSYQIALNEYMLIFFFTENEMQKKLQLLCNTDNSKIRIGFAPDDIWAKEMDQIFSLKMNQINMTIQETGENPLFKRRKNI